MSLLLTTTKRQAPRRYTGHVFLNDDSRGLWWQGHRSQSRLQPVANHPVFGTVAPSDFTQSTDSEDLEFKQLCWQLLALLSTHHNTHSCLQQVKIISHRKGFK